MTSRSAPTAPLSKPKAANICYLELFFPSPTPTATITPTSTPTLTPTPFPGCGESCDSQNSSCQNGLVCVSGTNGSFCSLPEYQNACQNANAQTAITLCCTAPTSTPTPTPTSTLTPTLTPTSTPTPTLTPTPTILSGCYSTCTSDSNCSGSMVCQNISGISRCVNSSCPYNSDCVCSPQPTNTLTPTPQTYIAEVPTATPTEIILKEAGVTTTTWTAFAAGGLLVLLGILFFAL